MRTTKTISASVLAALMLVTSSPALAGEARLFLGSSGNANTSAGDGVLTATPSDTRTADRYTYDPQNPVPSTADRATVQTRRDVLVYSGAVLDKAVPVKGAVAVDLFAVSDAKDTDFTATLDDVQPDGSIVPVGSTGIVHARNRKGPRALALTPGQVERYRIDLGTADHVFLPGHRIRLEISSSAAPLFAPNHNTGNAPEGDTAWKLAHQYVLHDSWRPSALVLTVVE